MRRRSGASRSRALAVLAAAALACACAGGDPPNPAPPAAAPPAAPALRVATSGDYPPFSLRTGAEDPPFAGFDVELAERIAGDLGLALEWVPFRWPELEARMAANEMDVAMSGVTWRPWRAATGWMTRAVAVGGPCVAGDPTPTRVAVNRGGVLERFARRRFPDAEIRALDDNRALGAALGDGGADAVVTDSFERAHIGLPAGAPVRCAPPAERKVLWVAPGAAAALGQRLDLWLGANEETLRALRARWLGDPAPRTELDHLLDLLARRLAYMPAIAAAKRARGAAIEDPAREAVVLAAVRAEAEASGLDGEAMARLFELQIALGKELQAAAGAQAPDGPPLDLRAQIRPELERLGTRIVATAARVAPLDPAALDAADWAPLRAQLDDAGCARLRAALLALEPAR